MAENYDDYQRFDEVDPEFEQNALRAPWADIPRSNILPQQLWHFVCIDSYCSVTRESIDEQGNITGGKGQVVVVLRIVEPIDFKGRDHYERFIIGTDADRKASDQRLWLSGASRAATNLVKLIDHVGGRDYRDLKNKEFLAFTRNNNNYTNIDCDTLMQKGEALPGMATPAQRGRLRPTASGKSNFTAPQMKDEPCPTCLQVIPFNEMLEHIRYCRKPTA